MKKILLSTILLFLTLLLSADTITVSAQEADSSAPAGGYLFRLKENASGCHKAALLSDEPSSGITELSDTSQLYYTDSPDTLTQFISEDQMAYIEPDAVATLFDMEDNGTDRNTALTDDPQSSSQWYLSTLNVKPVWDMGMDGTDLDGFSDMSWNRRPDTKDPIVIAVIDSGMTAGLTDVDADLILPGKNILDDSDDVTDDLWHGTFVTGILAATRDNQDGIAGLLADSPILPVKAFDAATTSYSNIIKSIHYATSQRILYRSSHGTEGCNVCVINLSLGGTVASEALKDVCDEAIQEGILIVCAAGNKGSSAPSYPAQYTMGVGSVGQTLAPSSFSQYLKNDGSVGFRNKVWVCAPGESIRSYGCTGDSDGSYLLTKNGTSFSCPMVTALAALCKAYDNHLTQSSFMELLRQSSHYLSTGYSLQDQDVRCGYGLIDFEAAITQLKQTGQEHLNTVTGETAASCTSEGTISRLCTICGQTSCETIPAAGHSYQPGSMIPPGYTSEGYTVYTCSRCGQTIRKDFTACLTLPAPVLSAPLNTSTGIRLDWNHIPSAEGYYLERRQSGSWKRIKTITGQTLSYIDRSCRNGSCYQYRILAFTGNHTSPVSALQTACRLSPVQIKYARNKTSRTLQLKFSKNKKATGYRVEYSRSKTFKRRQSITLTNSGSSRCTLKKLTRNKTWYIRIAAYKKYAGKTWYSSSVTLSRKIR